MTSITAGERQILGIFIRWLAGATALYIVIDFIIDLATGISLPAHGMNTMILWGCAMITGDRYYKFSGQLPEKSFSWKMAIRFFVLHALLNILFLGLLLALIRTGSLSWTDLAGTGDADIADFLGNFWWIVAALYLFFSVVNLLAARFGFSMGAASAKKYAENQARKRS